MSIISNISSTNEIYLKDVCRVCLNDNTSELYNLFETRAPEMLQFCGFLEVKELDEFPKKICNTCISNITTSYELKQLCESSKSYFQSLLDLTTLDPILKVEPELNDDNSVINDSECQMDMSNNLINSFTNIETESLPKEEMLQQVVLEEPVDSESLTNEEVEYLAKEEHDGMDETLSEEGVSEEPVKFQCQKCTRGVFEHENDLFVHQSIHDPTLTCNQCKKSCGDIKILKRHIKLHMFFKKFLCKYCPKGFTESVALTRHIKHQHFKLPREKKHKCRYCGQKFVDNQYKLIHERKHTGETPLQCSVCEKSFYDPTSFKAHLDSHFGIKAFLCPQCGKSFLTGSLLKQHQHVHSDQTLMCNICGEYLSQPRTLKKHQKLCRENKELRVRE